MIEKVKEAAGFIHTKIDTKPRFGIILEQASVHSSMKSALKFQFLIMKYPISLFPPLKVIPEN